jgi:hypothetical protein
MNLWSRFKFYLSPCTACKYDEYNHKTCCHIKKYYNKE